MSDTGPGEIAALIGDEQKYRTFVVLKLQEHGHRLTNIESRVAGVSSSVDDYNEDKAQLTGAKRLLLGAAMIIGGVGGWTMMIFELIDHLKTKAP